MKILTIIFLFIASIAIGQTAIVQPLYLSYAPSMDESLGTIKCYGAYWRLTNSVDPTQRNWLCDLSVGVTNQILPMSLPSPCYLSWNCMDTNGNRSDFSAEALYDTNQFQVVPMPKPKPPRWPFIHR